MRNGLVNELYWLESACVTAPLCARTCTVSLSAFSAAPVSSQAVLPPLRPLYLHTAPAQTLQLHKVPISNAAPFAHTWISARGSAFSSRKQSEYVLVSCPNPVVVDQVGRVRRNLHCRSVPPSPSPSSP